MSNSSESDRFEQAEQITGKRVSTMQLELGVLRQQGILVDLTISGIGLFQRTASWDEVGIQADSDDPRLDRLSPGQKCVLPVSDLVKELRSIQTMMRNTLDKYSYDSIQGFHPYRWLPYTAYPAFRERWDELLDRFNQIKQEIIDRMSEYREVMANHSQQEAERSWQAIMSQGYEWVIIAGKPYDHDSFIQLVVERDLSRLPTINRIEEELRADYAVALVYGESDVAEDRLRAAQLQAETNEVYRQSRMADEQARHEHEMMSLEEQAKREKINAMLQEESKHARQQLEEMVSPFQGVFTALRRQIAEDATTILASVRKNGFVKGKVASKAKGLLELFDLMAIHSDYELRSRLIELKSEIGTVGEDRQTESRNTDKIISLLEEIKSLEEQAVSDLLAEPSRFSLIE